MVKALLIEDDESSLKAMEAWTRRAAYESVLTRDLESARRALHTEKPALVLLDLKLPDGNGLDLFPDLEGHPGTEVVVITGNGSIDSAVEAMRLGAMDYLTKPVDVARLKRILDDVSRTQALRIEVRQRRKQGEKEGVFGPMLGRSDAMLRVFDTIERVAPTDARVMVIGETGSGKELVAEAIVAASRRADAPFLAVNCGAISPTLIESELFGHEKGAFTGATRQHNGVFERADGGTLFLDEITEMPAELQVKLLRVLETGVVQRIGGTSTTKVDVRLISATNREPEVAVRSGDLREDLLHRLMVFPISLPPLRERREDIELLARRFLDELNAKAGCSKVWSQEALNELRGHAWPGNVRQLRNVVERASILADGEILPSHVLVGESALPAAESSDPSAVEVEVGMSVAEAEKALILKTLDQCEGNKTKAAQVLGISLKTLYNRLNAYAGT